MIPEIVGAVLTAMLGSSLFKKKPYCIFVRNSSGWTNANPGGNSLRRCRKAVAQMIGAGVPGEDIIILPKGVTPPK